MEVTRGWILRGYAENVEVEAQPAIRRNNAGVAARLQVFSNTLTSTP